MTADHLSICSDFGLLQRIWAKHSKPDGLFTTIVSSLGRLVNEKPTVLGVGTQMHGLGIPTNESQAQGLNISSNGYLDMGMSMVSSAASVGMSTVSSIIGSSGAGLGPQSSLKLRL
jgi:hypothetical protein